MSFWEAFNKGREWGIWLGVGLGIIADLFLVSTEQLGTLIGVFSVFVALGALSGIVVGLAIRGLIGTLRLLNWGVALFGGYIFSILTIAVASTVDFATVIVVPMLLLLRNYLVVKSPGWIERSVSEAIIWFLTRLIITFLVFCFRHFTRIELIGI